MRVAALMLLLTVVLSTAFADAPKVNLNAQNITLQDVAAQLTEQSGIQIVLDAEVTGSVSATLNGVDLEQVLDLITKPSNLVWQKLYAKPDETGKISMERIKAQVNALKALKDDPLVVFDPATGKQTVFARMENKAAEEIINPKELGLTPFYRIYKPETAVDPVTSSEPVTSKEFSDLSRKQLEMYAKMSPEEQRAAAE
ncbi:MAG TPA: hypothetical protein PLU88_15710, partial [Armatimonadota bacterium]|nr:hypothetical protein [Armatimonadota bacterium]